MKRLLSTALALLLASCGGASTAPALPEVPEAVDLGLISSTDPTQFQFTVKNNSGDTMAVSEITASGVASVLTGILPRTVQPGEEAGFTVTVMPFGAGPIAETVMAKIFDAGGNVTDTTTQVTAEAEVVDLTTTPSLDFGDVLPGTTRDMTVTVTNASTASTVQVSAAAFPTADYTLIEALPFFVQPGQARDLTVRYTATDPGAPSGDLTLTTNGTPADRTVAVQATTGGEEVLDLGTQTFDGNGDTPELTFDVPADAIGFMIEATANSATTVGLRLLEGPGAPARVYENENLTGAYLWRPQTEIFTAQIPNTDRTNLQLVAGGGTYKLKLLRWAGSGATVDVKIIIERRPAPDTQERGTLDLNVWLCQQMQNELGVSAATATENTTLQGILTAMANILAQRNVIIGDITYYDVNNPTYDSVTQSEFAGLLQLSAAATDVRLNLFFVKAALPDIAGGILGVAATLGGPKRNGTQFSGVMSEYNGSQTFIGLVAAHELGHLLGLAHTQEQNGSHDQIDDTDNCPSCTGAGGGYLMHWQAVGGTNITHGQGLVVWAHPFLAPALAPQGSPKPRLPVEIDVSGLDISPDWCATCRSAQQGK